MNLDWKHLFDWTPVSVTEPRPEYYEYADIGKQMIGFQVTVEYKYHGKRQYSFSIDNEKLGFATEQWAKKRADKFYNKMKKQIEKGR